MPTPQGHIRKRGSSYEIAVPVGRDPVTGRYRYAYEKASTLEAAKKLREEMLERIADGRDPAMRAPVGELLDRWLKVAELELTTRVTYEGYIERVIRPVLGDMRLRHLERHVEILDDMYAGLRKCRRLCGGQRDLIDHRPPGQASKAAKARGGEVAHQCDERCRQHVCRPLEPATIQQIHSILRRAFRYAVKWRWIRDNPAVLATVPRARQKVIEPPSPAEAVKLLAAAEEHSPELRLFVWMVMVTGARRGELCALRWSDLDLQAGEMVIARALAVKRGTRVEKDTKTHQARRLALDSRTVEILAEHRERQVLWQIPDRHSRRADRHCPA